jgi:hypothetical protein
MMNSDMTGRPAPEENTQDKAVALNKVVNVLWRASHLAEKDSQGMLTISGAQLLEAYESAYPKASGEEYALGLQALTEIRQVSLLDSGVIAFDLSNLE